jgi:hypothetical protein
VVFRVWWKFSHYFINDFIVVLMFMSHPLWYPLFSLSLLFSYFEKVRMKTLCENMSTHNSHELWKNWKITPKEPNALLGELDSNFSVFLFEEFDQKNFQIFGSCFWNFY